MSNANFQDFFFQDDFMTDKSILGPIASSNQLKYAPISPIDHVSSYTTMQMGELNNDQLMKAFSTYPNETLVNKNTATTPNTLQLGVKTPQMFFPVINEQPENNFFESENLQIETPNQIIKKKDSYDDWDDGEDLLDEVNKKTLNMNVNGKKPVIVISESQQKFKGYIKFFDETKNYGFIVNESTNQDVFVHFQDLNQAGLSYEDLKYLTKGGSIYMEFGTMKYLGKYDESYQAIDIKILKFNKEEEQKVSNNESIRAKVDQDKPHPSQNQNNNHNHHNSGTNGTTPKKIEKKFKKQQNQDKTPPDEDLYIPVGKQNFNLKTSQLT